MEGGAAEVAEGKDETLPKSQGYADSKEAQQQPKAAEIDPGQSSAPEDDFEKIIEVQKSSDFSPENFSPDVAQFNT